MPRRILRNIRKKFGRRYKDINPEDIFIDSANLPGFAEHRLEGRIEQPMSQATFNFIKGVIVLMVILLAGKLWMLEVRSGAVYADMSEKNRLEHTLVFANRGVIYDRNKVELATNATREDENSFAGRIYAPIDGVAHVVGYLKYPSTDSKGFYYDESYHGRDGAERIFDKELGGTNGLKLRETDVKGKVTSESVIDTPVDGAPLTLSIDAKVTEAMYNSIKGLAEAGGYSGGAGVILDVNTGEVMALTSYPEYNANVITAGADKEAIKAMLTDKNKPFLDRAVAGLYTPGSIIKPIVALGALNEGIIGPDKQIESKGLISIPNPYDPSHPSIFRDWRVNGWTDMREALAVSSDVYFYSIGGGYGGQKGLGIDRLDKYFRLFGLSDKTGIELGGESTGLIPTPAWKAANFDGDPWRLGDTYITSIGQYGTQVTPIAAARYVASLANEGKLLTPSILLGGKAKPLERSISLPSADWDVIHEGMRASVTHGTSVALNVPYVSVAAKSGTAQIGAGNSYINSWSVGFFPYEHPRYAFAFLMERSPVSNTLGAAGGMRHLLDWMNLYAPQYFTD